MIMKKDKIKFKTYLVDRYKHYRDSSWYDISGGDMGTSDAEYLLDLEEDWEIQTDMDCDEYEDCDE